MSKPISMPQPTAGFGSAISAALQTVVYTATATGKVAQIADTLADIGLDKAINMRESVAITDSMAIAVLRAAQKQQLEALTTNGIELRSADQQAVQAALDAL